MAPYKYSKSDPLKLIISIRLPAEFYNKLEEQRKHSNCQTISEFARKILQEKKIIWYHKDATMDAVATELAGIKSELRSIGININQVTRYFNSAKLPDQKIYQALKVLEEYQKVSNKVDNLVKIISELGQKWSPR
jgi:hypothetical protein